MKVKLLLTAFLFGAVLLNAQPNLSSWHLNTTGTTGKYWTVPGPTLVNMTDSSGITKLCYTSTHIYVRTRDLAFNYVMGPSNNPNTVSVQNFTFKIPKNPSQEMGTKTNVPAGLGGLALNGIIFYNSSSADSYNSSTNSNSTPGDGKWHCDAWHNEKNSMDTSGNGHADGLGKYHYHANPITLYSDPSTAHSPIVGYAIDGYPIYGPYGYSTPLNNASPIKRIKSSYQMRSITTRTALPSGGVSTPAGPNVSASFPLGMYVEDYEYQAGSGDLDDLNGRYCVTPEYPTGTYAYFITTDNAGAPAYPYILALQFYGVVSLSDMGPNLGKAGIPTSGVTCLTSVSVGEIITTENNEITVYPNPAGNELNIELKNYKYKKLTITDLLGKTMIAQDVNSLDESVSVAELAPGVYFVHLSDELNNAEAIRFVKN
jgi:hypothetical protein